MIRSPPQLPPVVRALRLHHWAKNVLVFVVPVCAHRLAEREVWGRSTAAFLSFGLVASALYVLNDLWDQEVDRLHARKRHRPIASGELLRPVPALLILGLLVGGLAIALTLPRPFLGALAGYAAGSAAYSLLGKRLLIADVLLLAALYGLRVHAGGAAVGIPTSRWLAVFSAVLFTSLALLKRRAEIGEAQGAVPGRPYGAHHSGLVTILGALSAALAVAVVALYTASPEAASLYRRPSLILAACPLLIAWLGRLWGVAVRGGMREDPLLFALRDPLSWTVSGAVVLLAWWAS